MAEANAPKADAPLKPPCPSCKGTGWVSFLYGTYPHQHCAAQGSCRCVGGNCWRYPTPGEVILE